MYGMACQTLDIEEATTLGAAILAAMGAELFQDVEEAISHMVKVKDTYIPNMKNHEIYNEYFKVYKDAYRALKDAKVYERLVKLALEE